MFDPVLPRQCSHTALAFVSWQADGSVLLRPHGAAVAPVLPAVQKIAVRDRGNEGHDRQTGWIDGWEVLYGAGKCPFLFANCQPLPVELVCYADGMANDMAFGRKKKGTFCLADHSHCSDNHGST